MTSMIRLIFALNVISIFSLWHVAGETPDYRILSSTPINCALDPVNSYVADKETVNCEGRFTKGESEIKSIYLTCSVSSKGLSKSCRQIVGNERICMVHLTFHSRPRNSHDVLLTSKGGCNGQPINYYVYMSGHDFNNYVEESKNKFLHNLDTVQVRLSQVILDKTKVDTDKLNGLLHGNFKTAENIYIYHNTDLKELKADLLDGLTARKIHILNSHIGDLEAETFKVKGSMQEIYLGGFWIKTWRESMMVIDNCRSNSLNVDVSVSLSNPEIKSNNPIIISGSCSNKRAPSLKLNITKHGEKMSESLWKKVVLDGSKSFDAFKFHFDAVRCCEEENGWLFDLDLETRKNVKTSCNSKDPDTIAGSTILYTIKNRDDWLKRCKRSDPPPPPPPSPSPPSSTPKPDQSTVSKPTSTTTQSPSTTPLPDNNTTTPAPEEASNGVMRIVLYSIGGAVLSLLIILIVCRYLCWSSSSRAVSVTDDTTGDRHHSRKHRSSNHHPSNHHQTLKSAKSKHASKESDNIHPSSQSNAINSPTVTIDSQASDNARRVVTLSTALDSGQRKGSDGSDPMRGKGQKNKLKTLKVRSPKSPKSPKSPRPSTPTSNSRDLILKTLRSPISKSPRSPTTRVENSPRGSPRTRTRRKRPMLSNKESHI